MLINAPGDVHDSVAAEYGFMYEKLAAFNTAHGGKCVIDSAFPLQNHPCFLRSSQQDVTSRDERELLVNVAATKVRQLSEWGMRGFQGSFPRTKDRLQFEVNGERKIIIHLMVLLYNARAHLVGINQIKNTFLPALEKKTLLDVVPT